MKKFLACALAAVMCLGAFAGCSSSSKPAEENKEATEEASTD